jgi:hypothetical protein
VKIIFSPRFTAFRGLMRLAKKLVVAVAVALLVTPGAPWQQRFLLLQRAARAARCASCPSRRDSWRMPGGGAAKLRPCGGLRAVAPRLAPDERAYFTAATAQGLDWPILWRRLVSLTQTEAGRALMQNATAQTCHSVQDVLFAHDCIGELAVLRTRREALGVTLLVEQLRRDGAAATSWKSADFQCAIPLDGILDVTHTSTRATRGGVMEQSDVRRLVQVGSWISASVAVPPNVHKHSRASLLGSRMTDAAGFALVGRRALAAGGRIHVPNHTQALAGESTSL